MSCLNKAVILNVLIIERDYPTCNANNSNNSYTRYTFYLRLQMLQLQALALLYIIYISLVLSDTSLLTNAGTNILLIYYPLTYVYIANFTQISSKFEITDSTENCFRR